MRVDRSDAFRAAKRSLAVMPTRRRILALASATHRAAPLAVIGACFAVIYACSSNGSNDNAGDDKPDGSPVFDSGPAEIDARADGGRDAEGDGSAMTVHCSAPVRVDTLGGGVAVGGL